MFYENDYILNKMSFLRYENLSQKIPLAVFFFSEIEWLQSSGFL